MILLRHQLPCPHFDVRFSWETILDPTCKNWGKVNIFILNFSIQLLSIFRSHPAFNGMLCQVCISHNIKTVLRCGQYILVGEIQDQGSLMGFIFDICFVPSAFDHTQYWVSWVILQYMVIIQLLTSYSTVLQNMHSRRENSAWYSWVKDPYES